MADPITVVIPVGPNKNHCRWLAETLDSIAAQTHPCDVLLIDDMHKLDDCTRYMTWERETELGSIDSIKTWKSPWRLGVAHAFNFGVALAETDKVFMLGADDTMEPMCIEKAVKQWYREEKIDGYYYAGVRYMDTQEVQTVPCGEAMVTKGFWKETGGFPIESAIGACDAAFISMMMVHKKGSLLPIADGAPIVNYRRHNDSDTAGRYSWQGPILQVRDLLTLGFTPPEWGRYA